MIYKIKRKDEKVWCPDCGSKNVTTEEIDHIFPYGDGIEEDRAMLAAHIPVRKCEDCKEEWLDCKAMDLMEEAVKCHLQKIENDILSKNICWYCGMNFPVRVCVESFPDVRCKDCNYWGCSNEFIKEHHQLITRISELREIVMEKDKEGQDTESEEMEFDKINKRILKLHKLAKKRWINDNETSSWTQT